MAIFCGFGFIIKISHEACIGIHIFWSKCIVCCILYALVLTQTDNRREKIHTWTSGNKISNITADVSLSNMLPSTKISRAASSADWLYRLISIPCVCMSSTALSLLLDQGVVEIPRQ